MGRKARAGDVLAVEAGGRWYVARQLNGTLVEFFDECADQLGELDVESAMSKGPIFRIWVMDRATRSGRWKVIGKVPLSPSCLGTDQEFHKYDSISKKYSIVKSNPITKEFSERPATKSECEALERAAVWDPEHVERRLQDYTEGRTNKWVEAMKP